MMSAFLCLCERVCVCVCVCVYEIMTWESLSYGSESKGLNVYLHVCMD